MDNEDVNLDWEGLECDILQSISMKALKNAFELCAPNAVTNLGILGKKNVVFFFLVSSLHSHLFSSLSFKIYVSTALEPGLFSTKVDLNAIF